MYLHWNPVVTNAKWNQKTLRHIGSSLYRENYFIRQNHLVRYAGKLVVYRARYIEITLYYVGWKFWTWCSGKEIRKWFCVSNNNQVSLSEFCLFYLESAKPSNLKFVQEVGPQRGGILSWKESEYCLLRTRSVSSPLLYFQIGVGVTPIPTIPANSLGTLAWFFQFPTFFPLPSPFTMLFLMTKTSPITFS